MKASSSPGEARSPGRACPRETGDFSVSGQTQRTFLSALLSSQPGPLQAAQPPPACMGAGCRQGPPVTLSPSPHPGTYLTHEAKGSDDAPDADTAIINAEGGQAGGDDKKEYFI